MEDQKPSRETLEKWRKDPNNWKYGFFYFNPEDKRILPPKRTPWMGWTVNFANRNSVLFFVFLILFLAIITSILKK
ncbi:hypothetical protein D3C80_1999460 [compost metagenome]